jgi:hypothetical protein
MVGGREGWRAEQTDRKRGREKEREREREGGREGERELSNSMILTRMIMIARAGPQAYASDSEPESE